MKKFLPPLSLSLLFVISLVMSCSKDDPDPKNQCDGSLALAVDSKTNLTTCVVNDGSITVVAAGGKVPYQYSLNGGTKQTSATFSGLSAGTYRITVFDSNGCEDTETGIAITSPSTLGFLSVTPTADTDCNSNNGSIVVVGKNGDTSSTYQYALNAGAFVSSGTFSSLASGNYTVKVKDAAGCTLSQSVTVAQSTNVSFSGTIKPIIDANCATSSSCHASGAVGRPVLTTYSEIKSNASKIKSLTASGAMPQGGGSLTTQQKADIACWVDGGAPNN
jgi:hypothetical protein